jgi:DNA-binding MarR family transcriptional regulator
MQRGRGIISVTEVFPMMEITTLHRSAARRKPEFDRDLARELGDVMGQLRRTIRRSVRRGWPHAPLAENQVELVRLLRERPGIRVQDAAAALGLADNSVSALVGPLSAQGWVRRQTDPRDGRAALLDLSAEARRRIADWQDRRGQLIGSAVDRLSTRDRETLAAAIPALRSLREALEAES